MTEGNMLHDRTPALTDVLAKHVLWLNGKPDGKRADLRRADLRGANLSRADLSRADLRRADLRDADLRDANLRDADLRGADLRGADLRGAKGLLDPVDWLSRLEATAEGVICYKTFGSKYPIPKTWQIERGGVLNEVVNLDPTVDCACGINVSTLDWAKRNGQKSIVWKCLIRWPWLVGAVVPYHTNGKFRVGRVELVEMRGELDAD